MNYLQNRVNDDNVFKLKEKKHTNFGLNTLNQVFQLGQKMLFLCSLYILIKDLCKQTTTKTLCSHDKSQNHQKANYGNWQKTRV